MGQDEQPPWGEGLPAALPAELHELRLRCAQCPDPELLQAAQSGVLSTDLQERVNRHVASCPMCKCLIESFATMGEPPLQSHEREAIWNRVQAGIGGGSPTAAARRVPSWRTLFLPPWAIAAAAATVAISAIGIGWLRERGPAPPTLSQASPSLPAPTANAFRLEKAPVNLPASAVLVWRGADAGAIGKDLQDALTPYSSGDYAEAAQRFEGLALKYPRLAEAHFYLGVCRLFVNDNNRAAEALAAARDLARPPLADEVNWYLALAYHRMGQEDAARPLLEGVCRSSDRNSVSACTALQELPVVK